MIRLVRKPCAMPAQTKTEPPPRKMISFKYTAVGITLISPMVNSNTTINSMNGKPRLVREKNAIPLLSKQALVCMCPINTPKQNQHKDGGHFAHPHASDCAQFGQLYSSDVYNVCQQQ